MKTLVIMLQFSRIVIPSYFTLYKMELYFPFCLIFNVWNSVENVSYRSNLDMCCLYYLRARKPYSVLCLGYAQQRKRVSIFSRCKRYFSLTKRPDQLWRPPSLLFSRFWGISFQGRTARA